MPHSKRPINILIIDDDEDDFLITKDYIKNIRDYEFEIDWCFRYADAVKMVKECKYDLYFVDYFLGPKTGLDFIHEAVAGNCQDPIILLTGKGNHTIDLQAMQAGAYDYLVKSELTSEKLERCIRYSLERAASVKALKDNERKFRNIFEKSKDVVFIADNELRFRDVNDAACDLLEYSKEELSTLSLLDIMADATEKPVIAQQLEMNGIVNDKEVDVLTKNHVIRNCVLSVTRETDMNGSRYLQGILHDISNLKRAEKANLQIQKLAVTSRLVRTLAHEIRNPLNNINLSTEQLQLEDEQSRTYIDIITRSSKRIDNLISELLNSSKQGEMSIRPHSLQTIMDESIAAALDRLTLKRIQLNVSYANSGLRVMADAEKLKIAFLNIIINAIEAMEEDKGKLTISIRNTGPEHVVMIEDNGSGISPENFSRLFEPYFTTKRSGLGLGLASALSTLQSHHAYIDVQSKVGEGTTFLITFKAAEEESEN